MKTILKSKKSILILFFIIFMINSTYNRLISIAIFNNYFIRENDKLYFIEDEDVYISNHFVRLASHYGMSEYTYGRIKNIVIWNLTKESLMYATILTFLIVLFFNCYTFKNNRKSRV